MDYTNHAVLDIKTGEVGTLTNRHKTTGLVDVYYVIFPKRVKLMTALEVQHSDRYIVSSDQDAIKSNDVVIDGRSRFVRRRIDSIKSRVSKPVSQVKAMVVNLNLYKALING